MPRIVRTGGSLAIVLVAYWVYGLLAVPLIEPPAKPNRAEHVTDEQRRGALREANHRLASLRPLFRPGDWELQDPKILESDRIKLLLREYVNRGNGRVEIHPCTLIYTPEEPLADPVEQLRRSVILQSPEGALLEFDRDLDLRRGKVGRLVRGRLRGRVTIRSEGRKPGAEDNLFVVTRDIDVSEERISTADAIEFRWGPNYGRGAEMEIRLLRKEEPEGPDGHAPEIAGMESFELRRLERLHLEFPQQPSRVRPVSPIPGRLAENLPIEVTCRGPFRFSAPERVATFRDEVNVLRIHPDGPSDQINCELLSVYFARRRQAVDPPAEEEPASGGPSILDLQPRRIEARGNPVVVRAPVQQFQAWGEHLEYDAWSGRILLDGSQEVFLQQAANEIHAWDVQYQPGDTGQLGQIVAKGPGWLRGQRGDRPGQEWTARWTEQLQVRPHESQHVVSLTGGAHLAFAEMGKLTGAEIHCWLFEVRDQSASQARFRPDRMLARGKVHLDSAQVSGDVDQLEVWFEEPRAPTLGTVGGAAEPPGLLAQIGSQWERAQLAMELARRFSPSERLVRRPVISEGNPAPPDAGGLMAVLPPASAGTPAETLGEKHEVHSSSQEASGPFAPETAAVSNHFEITGKLLRAKVLIQKAASQLCELMVDGRARFVEIQTSTPGEKPVVVSGDQIHVVDATQAHAAVTVTGSPAHFEGRGFGLTGSNINLNRGTNRLWMAGPGQMDLPPPDRDLQGQPIVDAGPMVVRWQGRMSFDGKTARFEEGVLAETGGQRLETAVLDVLLKRPVRFADPRTQPDPELEQILCHGDVLMENRSLDQGGLASHERMQMSDLSLELVSGEITARGPGWMTSVRRGSGDLLPGAATPASADTSGVAADSGNALNYLRVRFRGNIGGNIHHQSITFHQGVRATFGPVNSWEDSLNEDDPDKLGPRAAILSCDDLTVVQMPQAGSGRRAVELEASGNTEINGATFFARARRMTYAQAKDLLILEGDGWTDAELHRQEVAGGPAFYHAARKILYWPSTRQFAVEGARALELNQLPAR